MATGGLSYVLQRIRQALPDGGETDAQLLVRFTAEHDETAFEGLLRRHAALVFGTARRILGNGPDAEDAFQATFLVLLRKARSVSRPELLGNWLFGVAVRTARKAKAHAGRYQDLEKAADPIASHDPVEDEPERTRHPLDDGWPELRGAGALPQDGATLSDYFFS